MVNRSSFQKSRSKTKIRDFKFTVVIAVFFLLFGLCFHVFAAARDQAKRMHDRLVGIAPSATTLDDMEAEILKGDSIAAANIAMSNPVFYNVTLKNFITPWTNVGQTAFAPLNDYTATVIGLIRDDNVPFTEVLSGDIIYTGATGVVPTAYSHTDNQHYIELEENKIDLSDTANLVRSNQSTLPNSQLGAADTAGIITTRAAGEAFFSAGTNRRMWRFIGINYLCLDMEQLNDVTRVPDRIRQDVPRSPGGDSSVFLNSCVGCHSGMDPLTQAFAYYEFNPVTLRVEYTGNDVPPTVQGKYFINSGNFSLGFVTPDDRWDNYWRAGPNSLLGWRGPNSGGNGAKSLGQEVAASRAFSECQVKKVFQQVCFRPPTSAADNAEMQRISDVFEAQNYSMKRVFAETASYCKGV